MLKHRFTLPQGETTVVLLNQAEFDELYHGITNLEFKDVPLEQKTKFLNSIKEKQRVPMMRYTSVTSFIFMKYNVTTQFMCVALNDVTPYDGNIISGDLHKFAALYNNLAIADKEKVDITTNKILELLKTEGSDAAECVLSQFISTHTQKNRMLKLALKEQTAVGLSVALGSAIATSGNPWAHERELRDYVSRILTSILLGGRE